MARGPAGRGGRSPGGGDASGAAMLVGTALVIVAMIALFAIAGNFGHTRTINADLSAPRVGAAVEPDSR